MDEMTLATELLHEIKQSAKRWFIAFCVMVVLEICTIVGFLWYISLPVDTYTIEQGVEDAQNSQIRQIIGGDDYESISESDKNTESNAQ